MVPTVILLGLAGCAPAAKGEDGTISQAAKVAASGFKLEPGYRAEPVASEPLLANPVAFCFDPAGRIFVAETHRVHHGTEDNRNHMDWLDDDLAARSVADRRAYIERRMPDRLQHFTERSEIVRLLEDRDADGVYDRSSVFSDGYHEIESGAAAGVIWIDNRLLFACIPDLWELRDDDGDGRAEHRRSLAHGFGVHFALFGHDLHGLCEGPDGKIYFSIGDRGLHVETPSGLLSNPDSGAVLRCNPDGSELELFATGLRNPQELAFNELGDLFSVDNNSDSGDRARIVHIVEGMDAGWRMPYQYLPDRGPFNREKIWHTKNSDQPAGIVPPIAHLSDGPSGLCYYPGSGMTSDCDRSFFLADFRGAPASSGIRRFRLEQEGAGYRLGDDSMFLQGMLATDCEFGPDGVFYVSDWIDGWDGTGKGRLYRIANDDLKLVAARRETSSLLKETPNLDVARLVELLSHDNMRVRLAAQRRLASQLNSRDALKSLAVDSHARQSARIHAIWALGSMAHDDLELFETIAELCSDHEPEIRNQAARTLGRAKAQPEAERAKYGARLAAMLSDTSPRVRASAAAAIGAIRFQPATRQLLQLASDNGPQGDPIVRNAVVMGLAESQSEAELVEAAADSDESARLAIVLALGKQKSEQVRRFLSDPAEQVALEAARVIWDTPIPAAYDALAEALPNIASTNEPFIRRALAANQALRGATNLHSVAKFASNASAPKAMRDHAWQLIADWPTPSSRDPVHGQWRPLPAMTAVEVLAALETAWPTIQQAGDPAGIVVAAELGLPAALEQLPSLLEKPQADAELKARAIASLGRFNDAAADEAIDAGLESEDSSVRLAAYALLAARFPERAVERLTRVVDAGQDVRERQAAFDLLAKISSEPACRVLGAWLERVEQGDCPPELLLDVLEASKQASDQGVATRAAELAQRIAASADPAEAFAVAVQGGDASRGEKLFLSNESLSCRRCHSLTPGEQLVGPSLAGIGNDRSRADLIESITRPNATIVEGFQTTSLLLDTGMVVTGIVRREDDRKAVLLNADGKEVEVDLETVEDRVQGLSAMPEDLMKFMSLRDLRDLVEFLSMQRGDDVSSPGTSDAGHQIQ
jgi:quinoprotein glucose dehydrogenase